LSFFTALIRTYRCSTGILLCEAGRLPPERKAEVMEEFKEEEDRNVSERGV